MACVVEFNIDPIGKPRITHQGRFSPRAKAYYDWCDAIRLIAKTKKFEIDPSNMEITFVIPMPKSWSQKKRTSMIYTKHQQRPDLDNIAKAFLDALCEEDSHIWQLRLKKLWGHTGKIIVEIGND